MPIERTPLRAVARAPARAWRQAVTWTEDTPTVDAARATAPEQRHAANAASLPYVSPTRSTAARPAVVIDRQMRRIFQLIEQLGPSRLPLLLLGETGSGKEVVADWAHHCSPVRERALVRINCAGLTESVIESELFGHERGAFTGAMQSHRGVFEVADGGTLFLDEVAELPLRTQAKLLRVLETGEYSRLGSNQPRQAKVRLIAATHVDLVRHIEQGAFRRDLYFRLNGATIEIPPLRARPSEIVPLAEFFLDRCAAALGRASLELEPLAQLALQAYSWPGNVRELRNVVDCAVALCPDQSIGADLLMLGRSLHALDSPPHAAGPSGGRGPDELVGAGDLRREQAALEREHILAALAQTGGNQTRAAKLLRISRRTMTNKLNVHRIERPRKPSSSSGVHALGLARAGWTSRPAERSEE